MKTLLLSIAFFALISCENKKAAIVDRQRVLKRQIDSVDQAVRLLKIKYDKSYDYERASKDHQYIKDFANESVQAETDLIKTAGPFRREYDSLEMELKKY